MASNELNASLLINEFISKFISKFIREFSMQPIAELMLKTFFDIVKRR